MTPRGMMAVVTALLFLQHPLTTNAYLGSPCSCTGVPAATGTTGSANCQTGYSCDPSKLVENACTVSCIQPFSQPVYKSGLSWLTADKINCTSGQYYANDRVIQPKAFNCKSLPRCDECSYSMAPPSSCPPGYACSSTAVVVSSYYTNCTTLRCPDGYTGMVTHPDGTVTRLDSTLSCTSVNKQWKDYSNKYYSTPQLTCAAYGGHPSTNPPHIETTTEYYEDNSSDDACGDRCTYSVDNDCFLSPCAEPVMQYHYANCPKVTCPSSHQLWVSNGSASIPVSEGAWCRPDGGWYRGETGGSLPKVVSLICGALVTEAPPVETTPAAEESPAPTEPHYDDSSSDDACGDRCTYSVDSDCFLSPCAEPVMQYHYANCPKVTCPSSHQLWVSNGSASIPVSEGAWCRPDGGWYRGETGGSLPKVVSLICGALVTEAPPVETTPAAEESPAPTEPHYDDSSSDDACGDRCTYSVDNDCFLSPCAEPVMQYHYANCPKVTCPSSHQLWVSNGSASIPVSEGAWCRPDGGWYRGETGGSLPKVVSLICGALVTEAPPVETTPAAEESPAPTEPHYDDSSSDDACGDRCTYSVDSDCFLSPCAEPVMQYHYANCPKVTCPSSHQLWVSNGSASIPVSEGAWCRPDGGWYRGETGGSLPKVVSLICGALVTEAPPVETTPAAEESPAPTEPHYDDSSSDDACGDRCTYSVDNDCFLSPCAEPVMQYHYANCPKVTCPSSHQLWVSNGSASIPVSEGAWCRPDGGWYRGETGGSLPKVVSLICGALVTEAPSVETTPAAEESPAPTEPHYDDSSSDDACGDRCAYSVGHDCFLPPCADPLMEYHYANCPRVTCPGGHELWISNGTASQPVPEGAWCKPDGSWWQVIHGESLPKVVSLICGSLVTEGPPSPAK